MASERAQDASRARLLEAGAAAVIHHKLSFGDRLLKSMADGESWAAKALGSYLRLDVPSFLPKVVDAVSGLDLETKYILWTDPGNLPSLSLPRS